MTRLAAWLGLSAAATTTPPRAASWRIARAAGLTLGVTAFAVGVHSWSSSTAAAGFGTDLVIAVAAPGELDVTPSGPILQAVAMRPGSLAGGVLRVRNITGTPVRVRVRAITSTPQLGDAVDLSVTSSGRPIAVGRTASLGRRSTEHVTIAVRDSAPLEVRAQLRRAARGLIGEVRIKLYAEAVGRR